MSGATTIDDVATHDRSVAMTAHTILQRAVCLTLHCHYLGNNRRVALDDLNLTQTQKAEPTVTFDETTLALDVKVEADKDQLNLTKRLVDARTLRPAMRVLGKAKQYLRSRAIAAHRVFGERTYLVPSLCSVEVDERLTELSGELALEAQKVADGWAEAVATQAAKLGPLFDATQYPTADDVKTSFGLDWSFVSFAAPENLETVSSALFRREQAKTERQFADAYDEVRIVLRETLRTLVSEIAAKLAPKDDGQPRVFRGTILDDLADFLGSFDLRNIADDRELATVVYRLRGLTHGIDAEALRDGAQLREAIRSQMATATAELDALVETGRRGIRLGGLRTADVAE